jgi:hypothetical protein
VDHIENTASSVVASVSVAMETCLLCHCLAITVSIHSTVLAYSHHVTVQRNSCELVENDRMMICSRMGGTPCISMALAVKHGSPCHLCFCMKEYNIAQEEEVCRNSWEEDGNCVNQVMTVLRSVIK